nr:hypothetical protein [uncultured Acetatifactor sp.]
MSDVKTNIHLLFKEMNVEVKRIVASSHTADMATRGLLDYVPKKVAMAAEGYMIDLYKVLSANTLNEPVFQSAANANRFYELQLRQKIAAAYRFDVKELQDYIKGKSFNEINALYSTAIAGLGGLVVGGALLGLLSGAVVHISVAGIIAGAIVAGLASAGIYTGVSKTRKKGYLIAVQTFMADLEKELMKWVDNVIDFYNSAVNELKDRLKGASCIIQM